MIKTVSAHTAKERAWVQSICMAVIDLETSTPALRMNQFNVVFAERRRQNLKKICLFPQPQHQQLLIFLRRANNKLMYVYLYSWRRQLNEEKRKLLKLNISDEYFGEGERESERNYVTIQSTKTWLPI